MKKRDNIITVAIDSPAAAGAGTQAKMIAKNYNLFYLDTGKIYRFIGKLKLDNEKRFSYSLVKRKISNLKLSNLKNKSLLSNDFFSSSSASSIGFFLSSDNLSPNSFNCFSV